MLALAGIKVLDFSTLLPGPQHIFTLWQQKRPSSPVTRAMRLEDAAAALRRMADRGVLGKIVLLTRHYAGSLTPTAADAP
jgi:hypothetical protein